MRRHEFATFKHGGVMLDTPPEEVPAEFWTFVQGVEFDDGQTVRVPGYGRWFDPLIGPPIFAMNVRLEAVSYWFYCGVDFVAITDGTGHFDLTPAGFVAGVEKGTWTGCVLNGVPCLNNPRNTPMYWNFNTAGDMLPLPGWPAGALCRCLRSFKYHLFALGVTDAGELQEQTLWWSMAAEPGSIPQEWVPSAENDAGDMTLGDEPGFLLDAQPLRDTLIVYKSIGIYVLSYVAGQYVYTQRKLFSTVGALGSNCVQEYKGEHWVITADDVIRHDGQTYRSALQELGKATINRSIDVVNARTCCLTVMHKLSQVWVCIPTAGSEWLNRAYVIQVNRNQIGERELPNVAFVARGQVVVGAGLSDEWDDDTQAWDLDGSFWDEAVFSPTDDSLMMCQPASADGPHLQLVDAVGSADGVPLYALAERQGLPMVDTTLRGLCTRIVPRIDGGAGEVLQIRMGGQEAFGQPITWSDPQDFIIGTSTHVDTLTEGRFFALRVEGATLNKWRMHSYRLQIAPRGEF